MKRVLVTGGAGFIGTNLVYHLVKNGYQVVVLDKLTYAGGKDNLEHLEGKTKLVIGDICDADVVRKSLERCNWVVHLAAESHNTRSEANPGLFYRTNVDGTRIMLEESMKARVEKFIHISTDEVYGSIQVGYFFEEDKLRGAGQATSAYSRSKSLADDIAMEFCANGDPIIVLRPTNNFGPWQYPEKALPRWITNIMLDKTVPLWGKGLQVRDWLFAPLTALGIEFLLIKGENGNAYNIAANHTPEITNRQAATWICELMGVKPDESISYIPDPRPNHDFRYALNTDKIKRLGLNLELNIYEQLKQTVEWYKNNRKWWMKRKNEAESIYKHEVKN